MAIAVVFITGLIILTLLHAFPRRQALALIGGGALIAWIGWVDDRSSLPICTRLAAHFAAAVWAVVLVGAPTALQLGFATVPLGWFGAAASVIGIVWSINLFNFMDGLDGLAGAEAVMVAVIGGILAGLRGSTELALACFLLASASLGFLIWNWPPAKVFLGDVGSGLLGYVFAVFVLAADISHTLPFLVWLILMGVFVVDATATLLRRMARREKWYRPHRMHAYQLSVQSGLSHRAVTLTTIGLNLALAVIAVLCQIWPRTLMFLVAATMAALLWLQLTITRKGLARGAEQATAAETLLEMNE